MKIKAKISQEVNSMVDKRLEAAAQEEKREYFRKWRKNNPDKVKKHNENYWRKRAEKRLKAEAKDNAASTE
jgi:uncharacterized short protein YbdD (DUF466 family)